MTDERKRIIHDYYTGLYRLHLAYSDIDNAAEDAEELWQEYLLDKGEKLIEDAKAAGADEYDYKIFRKTLAGQMAGIEYTAKKRSGIA